jgi:hypothetical protein
MIDQFVDKRAFQEATSSGPRLTAAQVEAFNRDGFLILRQALARSEVEPLRAAAEGLFAAAAGEWISAPEKLHPDLQAYAHGPFVQGVIGELNGPSEVLLGFLYRKQCTSPVPKLWHQDAVYWDMSDARVMAMFTPVTPVNERNGAILVIPGSHRIGRLFHRAASNYNLVCDVSAFREPQVVTLEPGDVMLIHSFTLHCSPANPSPEPRINFGLHFHHRDNRIVRDAPTAAIYENRA